MSVVLLQMFGPRETFTWYAYLAYMCRKMPILPCLSLAKCVMAVAMYVVLCVFDHVDSVQHVPSSKRQSTG